jgi:hypothetical protein
VSPENWKVVRPCGSQRGSRSHTTAGTSAPWCSSPSRASPGDGTAPCPAQTLPRTRLLPDLVTDGFGQDRLRMYMNHAASPGPVALRSQAVLTGSGSHRSSYGGFGGGHPQLPPA